MNHHEKRLLARMIQAETVTDPEKAEKIIKKAEKHQRKLNQLHSELAPGDEVEE